MSPPGNLSGRQPIPPKAMSSPGSFGELIRERREAAGLSQAGLGKLVGRSASAVRNWERGQSLPGEPQVMSALATALGISEVELSRFLEPDRLPLEPPEEPEPSTHSPDWLEGLLGPLDRELALPSAPVAALPEDTRETLVEPAAPAASPAPPARPEAPPTIRPTSPKPPPAPQPPLRPPVHSAPAPAPSYVEDPEQMAFYRYRALVTASVLVMLLLVLLWAVGELRQAVRAVLELF
ncbi:MAG: helix-turn-helix domain-containing protein [Acidimicrobiia bacterium]